jgi:hypothetical protein
VVVQRREWAAGHDAAAVAKNFYLPVDYQAVDDQVVLVDATTTFSATGRSSFCSPRVTRPAISRSAWASGSCSAAT